MDDGPKCERVCGPEEVKGRGLRIHFGVAAAVLLAAILLQSRGRLSNAAGAAHSPALSEVLPRVWAGWQVEDVALGSTEMTTAVTLKTLSLNDYVYRRYSRGTESFTVYVAYWSRGKMPVLRIG
jgi:hypothetical protein